MISHNLIENKIHNINFILHVLLLNVFDTSSS